MVVTAPYYLAFEFLHFIRAPSEYCRGLKEAAGTGSVTRALTRRISVTALSWQDVRGGGGKVEEGGGGNILPIGGGGGHS